MHLQQLQSCPAWVPIGFCIPLTSVGEMSTSLTPWLLPSPPGCHKGTGQPWSHPGRESACCEDRTCWHGASGLQVHSSCIAFLLHCFPPALLSSRRCLPSQGSCQPGHTCSPRTGNQHFPYGVEGSGSSHPSRPGNPSPLALARLQV